jgi:hypothetical protein
MAKIPPKGEEESFRQQREKLNEEGRFWSEPMTQEESARIMQEAVKIEEAKARQEEAKAASRNTTIPPKPTSPDAIALKWAMPQNISTLRLEYLVDPYLPAKCVVGVYGRGSTAKSSFVATLAARISEDWSTLWVSVEEPPDWIAQRHLYAGGEVGTLAVFTYAATKRDAQGRVVGSSFDVYRDLESSIVKAKEGAAQHYDPPRPLRLVVLDTAVGLTGWGKGESPNDDAAVKRLLAYLQALAEAHNLCIVIIGHSNKGKHDHFADTVAGSTAWTNSPRLSFVHARDRREEYTYVMRVAKSNLSSAFAVAYSTVPVLELHQHEDGHASVVCKVDIGPVVWGEEAATEMFEAATRVDHNDDEGDGNNHRGSLVDNVLETVVRLVHQSSTSVTREMVETDLGRPVGRREWKKVDDRLAVAEFQHKVALSNGPQNKVVYHRLA